MSSPAAVRNSNGLRNTSLQGRDKPSQTTPQLGLAGKLLSKLRNDGIATTAKQSLSFFYWKSVGSSVALLQQKVRTSGLAWNAQASPTAAPKNPVGARRRQIAKRLDAELDSTVRYGPLQGFKFASHFSWGNDRSAMLLGLYEQEVLESVHQASSRYRCFVDLGAADGYYGVGVVATKLFEKSYCFEMNEESRKLIQTCAEINGIENSVTILGEASTGFYKTIPDEDRSESVLFVDIEGAEFDVLRKDVFDAFQKSVIFVELHEWFYPDGDEKLNALRARAQQTHSITEIRMGGRDVSQFPELALYHDDDRFLVCSEGRPRLMTWWRLDPR